MIAFTFIFICYMKLLYFTLCPWLFLAILMTIASGVKIFNNNILRTGAK